MGPWPWLDHARPHRRGARRRWPARSRCSTWACCKPSACSACCWSATSGSGGWPACSPRLAPASSPGRLCSGAAADAAVVERAVGGPGVLRDRPVDRPPVAPQRRDRIVRSCRYSQERQHPCRRAAGRPSAGSFADAVRVGSVDRGHVRVRSVVRVPRDRHRCCPRADDTAGRWLMAIGAHHDRDGCRCCTARLSGQPAVVFVAVRASRVGSDRRGPIARRRWAARRRCRQPRARGDSPGPFRLGQWPVRHPRDRAVLARPRCPARCSKLASDLGHPRGRSGRRLRLAGGSRRSRHEDPAARAWDPAGPRRCRPGSVGSVHRRGIPGRCARRFVRMASAARPAQCRGNCDRRAAGADGDRIGAMADADPDAHVRARPVPGGPRGR